MRVLEHHDGLGFLGPNLQKLDGMHSCPTSNIPLSFLFSNQENKKCVISWNLCNPYSCVKTLVLIRSKMSTKSIQSKSSFVVFVQAIIVYLIVCCVRALTNMC
jgi:hypothetical protein